jgi:hypothetical protein
MDKRISYTITSARINMDTITTARDTINEKYAIYNDNAIVDNNSIDNATDIETIRRNITELQERELILNEVIPLRKSDGTAKILKNNFKHLYNKQYTKNATLIVGILLVSGIIIKMSFYETIDYPRVL